jgi:hypothetical protein
MPDIVLVAACVPIVGALVFFLADKFNRLWIERSWRQHSAFYGDMDSPAHVTQGETMANRLMENIRAVFGPGRERNRENVPDNGGAAAPPSDVSAEQKVPAPGSLKANGLPVSGEVAIKIESTRCDVHPLYVLRPTVIEILSPVSNTARRIKASCCTKHGCDRHYLAECGYFDFVRGHEPAVSGLDAKPACSIHKGNYMALVKANGHFAWACLNSGCAQRLPYQEAS